MGINDAHNAVNGSKGHVECFKELLFDTIVGRLLEYGASKSNTNSFLGIEICPRDIIFRYEDKMTIVSFVDIKKDIPAIETLSNQRFITENRESFYSYEPV